MALTKCPECGGEVSTAAIVCPKCGHPGPRAGGFEYKSKAEIGGWPLVHVVLGRGMDPMTGRVRVARGVIAVGPIAVGGIALGGVSVGIIALGGVAFGLIALAGVAVGLGLAAGGLAIGYIALGGAAIGYWAFGGGAFGVHAVGANIRDPEAVELLRRWFGDQALPPP